MNKLELRELVKKYFSLQDIETPQVHNEEVVEQSFATAKLADGTEITNKMDEDFAPGQKLFVVTAEGEEVAAPEGEHTSESGITIVVDGEGTITGVHHPDEEGEGSLEEMAVEEMEEEIVEEIKSEDLIEAISELVMPEIEAMKSEMASCMERLAKAEEMMAKYEEKMSATPAAESKTTSKFSKQTKSISNSEGPKYNKRRYEATLAQLTKR